MGQQIYGVVENETRKRLIKKSKQKFPNTFNANISFMILFLKMKVIFVSNILVIFFPIL